MSKEETSTGHGIVVVYCQQCVQPETALHMATAKADSFPLRTEMIPCSSKLRVSHLLKILEQGMDGLEVVCCPQARCRFLVGSERAGRRVEYARKLLLEAGLAAECIGISEGTDLTAEDIVALGKKRADALSALADKEEKEGLKQ